MRAAALRHVQPDLIGRQEPKTSCHGIDQHWVVARNDAEVIADAVAQAGRQLHLDVAGGTPVVADVILKLSIFKHLHRNDAALRHRRIGGARCDRLDGVERRVVGAARKITIDTKVFHRDWRHRCEP